MVTCGREWTHYFTSIEDIMKKSVIKGTLVTLMLAAACQQDDIKKWHWK